MDPNEKKERREFIAQYLDVSGTRFSDDDVLVLCDYIENFDARYRGRRETLRTTSTGSDRSDTYRMTDEVTTIFEDDMTITVVTNRSFDDGNSRQYVEEFRNARSIVNWLKRH